MLELIQVHTFYGMSHVLQGVSLNIKENGQIVALVGRNGAGKTTTLHSVIGFCPPKNGNIFFQGKNIVGLPAYKIVQAGISLVPQGRRIFPSLTVKENLEFGAYRGKKESIWNMDKAYQLFPALKKRAKNRGNQLSGGEMQMLAIARALLTNPKLILMDEPSEGLALLLVRELANIMRELKNIGQTILLVEQNINLALNIADYVYVINKGKIVYESEPDVLLRNEEIKCTYLGV